MGRKWISRLMVFVAAAFVCAGSLQAQLWHNEVDNGLGGVLVTHPGGMTGAAAGSDRSAIAVGGTLFGFGAQGTIASPNFMADNFTVGGNGWIINSVRFYLYQTGATAASVNDIRMQIWSSGAPGGGGSVTWGDLVTNVWSSTVMSDVYRTTNTGTTDTTRRIQIVDVAGLNIALGPGTYWLQWGAGGTLASGPWQAPLTLPGATGYPAGGDALQFLTSTGMWNPALDNGVQTDLPFTIFGTLQPPIPEPTVGVLMIGVIGMLASRRRK